MPFRIVAALVAAICLVVSNPSIAQQVNAGSGDDINIDGQSVTTNGQTALYAHDGGRIYNQPGTGNAVTITATGTAYGAYAAAGSTINLDGGGYVSTDGVNATAIYAEGAKSTITGAALNITASGSAAYGVFALNGGAITLTGGSIKTSGGYGLVVQGGSIITSSADVTTTGDNYAAVSTFGASAGTIVMKGVTILSEGASAPGLRANGAVGDTGSSITSEATVMTTKDLSHGAFANGGRIELTGGSVTTGGNQAHGLLVNGSGALTSSVPVLTTGGGAFGAYVQTSGTINLPGGSITTGGGNAHGLYAEGASAVINSAVPIGTSGAGAHGAFAVSGGTINLTAGWVTTGGQSASGLYAVGSQSIITSNVDVTTTGGLSHAVYAAQPGATINLQGGSILTTGDVAYGIVAAGFGAHSQITSVADVTTQGAASHGAVANNGTVILNGGTVTTTNANSFGLFATGIIVPGQLTSVADVSTAGDGSHGAFVDSGSITLNGGTISTAGAIGHGLYTKGLPGLSSSILAIGVTVATTGPGAAGLRVEDAGALTVSNSEVTSAQGNALLSTAQAGMTNAPVISRSVLSSTSNTAMVFQGGTQNPTLELSQVTGGNGTLLQVDYGQLGGVPDPTNPTTLNLAASASVLNGDMQVVDPGTNTANVTLSNGTLWTGASLGLTTLNVDGAAWNITGPSTITDTLTNGGAIAFQWAGAFNTLTTTNYAGTGGTINFNAALAADNSPSDKLIINGGTATGTTGVLVTNQGGPGALTTGNGIPIIVPTGGASIGAGTFSLAGNVAAGPYQYLLFQGTGGDTGYYLRSHCDADCPEPGPLYRPDVSVYSVLASMARQQELAALGTFHDRNGDQRLAAGAGQRTSAWGRLFGEYMEQSHTGTVSAHLDGSMGGLQAGVDAMQWTSASGHQDRFGLFAAYARTTGDVRGHALGDPNRIAGRAELDGTSVGTYWTHLAPSGWYTDAVLMGTRFDGGGSTVVGTDIDVKGYGVTASIEGGYPIALGAGLTLEPQAQLVYAHVNFDGVNDDYADVAYDTPDALFGRIGVRLSADMAPLPMVLRPYLKANLWQDFTETDSIRFSGVHRISTSHEATRLELGGGVIAQLSRDVGLWVNADYTTDIASSDDDIETIRGTAGLRVTW